MSQSFTCPNCSAPLDYSGDDLTIRCPYCGGSVIVPDALRPPASHAPVSAPQAHAPSPWIGGSLLSQTERLHEITRLIRGGNKIEAIKLYREMFNVGLGEAKDAVDRLEAGKPVLMPGSVVVTAQTSAFPSTPYTSSQVKTAVTTAGGAAAGGLACSGLAAVLILLVVAGIGIGLFLFLSPGGIPGGVPTASFASRTLTIGQGEGDGPGFFKDTRWIAVDSEGYIYAGDFDTGRIQIFAPDGGFVDQWKVQSDRPYLSALAAARDGKLYAVVGPDIQLYEARTGNLLGTLAEDGDLGRIDDIAITSDGSLVAASSDGLYWFNADGQLVRKTGQPLAETLLGESGSVAEVASVNSIAVDGSDNIYLAAFPQYYIFKLSPDGSLIDRIGGEGEGGGKFRTWPEAVAVDGRGRVFAYDFTGIQVFDANGDYLDTISIEGNTFDMVFNLQNELLVMDRNANQIAKYAINR